jgi:hypothetical protein
MIGPRVEKQILRMVVAAHSVLQGLKVVQTDWDEDRITRDLCTQITIIWKQLPSQLVSNLVPTPQFPVHPKASKVGRAPTIDFVFWRGYNEQVYFAFECKKVEHIDSKLITGYVEEGMKRYVQEIYASKMSRGGMIGYTFNDQIDMIIEAINARIRASDDLSGVDCLRQEGLDGFRDMYLSSHIRKITRSKFLVYHLILAFRV